jgi:DNA-binding XRE family transcriptional regulator
MNQETFNKKIGSNLKSLRLMRKELTQDKLAELVSLSRPSIVNIEKGRQQITVFQLIQFADALSVSPSDIIYFADRHDYPPNTIELHDTIPSKFRNFVNSALTQ